MNSMLDKVKNVKLNMDLEKEEKENQIKDRLKELIIELNNKCNIDKLNEILETGSYAFKNGILKLGINYSSKDYEDFIANGISHKIGLHSSYSIDKCEFNQIAILGGGICGNIGIVFQDNMFFITKDNADITDRKSYKLCIENVDRIFECYNKLSVQWIEYFINGINDFILRFEEKINNLK